MNRRSVTTTASHMAISAQPIPTTTRAQETAEQMQWLRKMTKTTGMNLEELRGACFDTYGSVQQAIDVIEGEAAREKEAVEKACREAGQPPIALGSKPVPGEKVTFAPISEDIAIRIWGQNLASYACFSFDFVNKAGQYMCTPPGVKIYAEATGFTPGGEVHSIEKSLELADPHNNPGSLRNSCDKSKADPNWETYVVPEGTILCVKQPNHEDHYVHIPMRHANGVTVPLLSHWT